MVVVTSCRCGTLLIVTGSSASRQEARIGSTAFFAPEIPTSPRSGSPPLIRILAIGNPREKTEPVAAASTARGGFFRRESFECERVDRAPHEVAQSGVDKAVTCQRQLARKLIGHDFR